MANRTDKKTQTLLVELGPRLEAERRLERELDRHLARRFNVFDYFRTDELGLSRLIADLLDPAGEHGQGTTFLKAMLDSLPHTRGRFTHLKSTQKDPIVVRTEHATDAGGFIDITVDIPDGDRSFCLAFENKPYARQKASQVTRYLSYLSRQYQQRFLLVYLPPSGDGPSARGLSQAHRALWESRFVVMPYEGENSLSNWFATCRRRCEAERVRMFLRDAELFCERVFGESTMTISRATTTAKDYLLENSRHLRTALAIHDAWSLVRDEVCKRFLEHLRSVVGDRVRREFPNADWHFRYHYGGAAPYSNNMSFFRDAWVFQDGSASITLSAEASRGRGGPNGWLLGLSGRKNRSEMTNAEVQWRDKLGTALRKQGLRLTRESDLWPQYDYVKRYRDWYPLVPELDEECDQGGGTITTYYVDNLLNIAAKAIPAIKEVEGWNQR